MLSSKTSLGIALVFCLTIPILSLRAEPVTSVSEADFLSTTAQKSVDSVKASINEDASVDPRMTGDRFSMGQQTPFVEDQDFWAMPENEELDPKRKQRLMAKSTDKSHFHKEVEVPRFVELVRKSVQKEYLVLEPSIDRLRSRSENRLRVGEKSARLDQDLKMNPDSFFTPFYYETGEALNASFRSFTLSQTESI